MSWVFARVYDRFMRATEEACLRAWRADLLGNASGQVIEVGAGTGANLPFYPDSVGSLLLTEPDPHLRRMLQARTTLPVVAARAEALPLADASFDCAVTTLVLCSVSDLDGALAEIRRVLRPGGRLLLIEHVAARNRPARLRWQRRFEPLWKRVAGNCHCTRRIADAIEQAGFRFETLTRESMRKALPIVRPSIRGVAVLQR